jgi:hypothetical protein
VGGVVGGDELDNGDVKYERKFGGDCKEKKTRRLDMIGFPKSADRGDDATGFPGQKNSLRMIGRS